jgi:hypothetical protein
MRLMLILAATTMALGVGFASAHSVLSAKPAPGDYCYGRSICK